MKISIKTLVLPIGLLFLSCTNSSPVDLVDNTTFPVGEKITYINKVKATIDNNCVRCHGVVPSNGAPMSLVTYEEVKQAVLELGLIDRLNKPEGDFLLMPQGGPKLPSTKINEIIQWQTDGLLAE